jgi:chitosanase
MVLRRPLRYGAQCCAGTEQSTPTTAGRGDAMQISETQKSLITRIINVFETGTPDGDYAAISIYKDGPHNVRQITYGRSQTTEYGNLRELVQDYIAANGQFSAAFIPYVNRIGGDVTLVDDTGFKNLLRQAGRTDPVMQQVQDRFFDKRYYGPALTWATAEGFTQALSMLVIYDSTIHSGGILWFLRNRFPESTPAHGGAEQAWIKAYADVRYQWLSTHSNPPVKASAYRVKDLRREIAAGNWDLGKLPFSANGVKVRPA